MNLFLLWLLIGSIGVNLLWINKSTSCSTVSPNYIPYIQGLLFGTIIGPLSIVLLITKIFKKESWK